MPTLLKTPDRFFYLAWVGLHIVSVFLALAAYWVIIWPIQAVVGDTILIGDQVHITQDYLLSFLFVPALALAHGLLQYALLRRYVPAIGWWAVATTTGWSLALFGTEILYATFVTQGARLSPIFLDVARVGLTGGTIGLAQWWVLRRRTAHAVWWIVANVVGWGISGVFASSLDLWVLGAPALATMVAWWFLLDRWPRRDARNIAMSP